MNAFLAVVLVCAAHVAAPDCTRETALDVVLRPTSSEIQCLQVGQVIAAQSFAADIREGRSVRVNCERRKTAAAGGAP